MHAVTSTAAPPASDLPLLAPNASFFRRFTLAVRSLQILANDPPNPHYGPLLNACMDSETYAKLALVWRADDDGRRLLDERPTLQGVELDLDALTAMPEGTLGHEFMRYFRDNKISPFVTTFPIASDVDYLSKRYRETHDLLHLVTGYGTDEPGEMELQAFVLGNLRVQQAKLILFFGAVRQMFRDGPLSLITYVKRARAAYARGVASKNVLRVPYETLWTTPVSTLASSLCPPM